MCRKVHHYLLEHYHEYYEGMSAYTFDSATDLEGMFTRPGWENVLGQIIRQLAIDYDVAAGDSIEINKVDPQMVVIKEAPDEKDPA